MEQRTKSKLSTILLTIVFCVIAFFFFSLFSKDYCDSRYDKIIHEKTKENDSLRAANRSLLLSIEDRGSQIESLKGIVFKQDSKIEQLEDIKKKLEKSIKEGYVGDTFSDTYKELVRLINNEK